MLGLSVRKATKKDAQDIWEVNKGSILGVTDFLYQQSDKQAWMLTDIEEVNDLIKSERHYTLVATLFGKIVGYGATKNNQLKMLYVYPEYQHRGIASQILKQLEKTLNKPIFKVSKNSVAFYQRHGYKIQGKTRHVIKDKAIDAFIVYKN